MTKMVKKLGISGENLNNVNNMMQGQMFTTDTGAGVTTGRDSAGILWTTQTKTPLEMVSEPSILQEQAFQRYMSSPARKGATDGVIEEARVKAELL